MKRQVDKTGGKLWFNENLIDGFQDQLYKAIESHYKPYGSCIVSGCEVSGSNIAEGIVYLDGKIMPFAGASGVTFPKYLKSRMTLVTAAYDDGHSDTTEEIYEAILSSTIPSGEYITVSAQGGKTFRQAFQDANNRMVSDAKINEWNAARGNAVSDVRGGVGSAHNTLQKIYAWAVELINKKENRTYRSVTELGLQNGTASINEVLVAMPMNSRLVIDCYSSNGIRVADRPNTTTGILTIDKSHNWRGILTYALNNNVRFIASISQENTYSGWEEVGKEARDILEGVNPEQNTLKKLYDWTVSNLLTKVDKSLMSSNISSVSTTNVATSKAVNDAKNNAIATASNDATTKANSARDTAIQTAAVDATNKANKAKEDAISEAKIVGYKANQVAGIPSGSYLYLATTTPAYNGGAASGEITICFPQDLGFVRAIITTRNSGGVNSSKVQIIDCTINTGLFVIFKESPTRHKFFFRGVSAQNYSPTIVRSNFIGSFEFEASAEAPTREDQVIPSNVTKREEILTINDLIIS